MPRKRVPPDEKELHFQASLASYRSTGGKEYRDQVFFCVQEACYAVAKKLLGKVRCKDFSDKVLDATCVVMARLDRNGPGDTPRKLTTFCYMYVLKAFYNPKEIRARKFRKELFEKLPQYAGDFNEFDCQENVEEDEK